MEIVMVLLLVGLIVIIGPAALILGVVNRQEIRRLRDELRAARSAAPPPEGATSSEPGPAPAARLLAPPPPPDPSERPEKAGVSAAGRAAAPWRAPAAPRDLESLVGGQWLTWLGVVTIFFGTAFFLAVDLTGNPLSGVGQILTGIAVALVFALIGSRSTTGPRRILGRGLLSGAVALLFLAGYASVAFHDLLNPLAVFPFLFGAALVGAALALRQNAQSVALLTLACALLTPVLLQGKGDPGSALFVYLLATSGGAALVAARRRWPALPLVAFAGVAILVGLWWSEHYDPTKRLTAVAGAGSLWLLFGVLSLLPGSRADGWGLARAVVALANGLFFLAVVHAALVPEYVALRGTAAALLALAYVGAARLGRPSPARVTTHYAGLVLAGLAVPAQLDAEWVTVGWALLAVVLLSAGVRGAGRGHRLLGYALWVLSLFRFVVFDSWDLMRTWTPRTAVLNADFAVGAGVCAALLVTAQIIRRRRSELGPIERFAPSTLTLLGATALLWRISLESIGAFRAAEMLRGDPGSTDLASLLTLSIIWAAYAGCAILLGLLLRYRPLRFFGMAVLGLLIVKVFLLDMQELERGYRIASFVGVGILLLAVSVLYQRERRS